MTSETLRVPDIHCDHCKTSIEGAVGALEGVSGVQVDVPAATVAVEYAPTLDRARIIDAIEDQGYEVA